MRRKIWFAFFLVCSTLAIAAEPPRTLQQKISYAQAGDFIVTAQEGNYSVLFIRSITADTLLLEEISVPEHQIDLKKIEWKKWVSSKAPGHTSWTLYEIDQRSGQLVECFSYSKNGWLYLDASEQFLMRLLTLPLHPVPEKERKRIGPPPLNGEEDRRSLWTPTLVVDGKKIAKPAFEVVKTQWPDDSSRLALCAIELYFDKGFPLPYWLEVHSPHYTFKLRTIDSGHALVSPMTGPMPHRPPQIAALTQKGKDVWKLKVRTPAYFQKLHLFALDLTAEAKVTIPVSCAAKSGLKNEEMTLEVATSELNQLLVSGHRYQWVLVPEGGRDIYVESEETFIWQTH
jgi:hypothetical protein